MDRRVIDTVVFDFGGVLLDWNPHYLYDPYFGSREKADWFLSNICTTEWNSQMDGGKPFSEGVAELSALYPEWSAEIHMFFDRWIEMMGGQIPGMEEIMVELRGRGYRILGLTNWSAETFCLVRNRYRVLDLLDGLVVSGQEHMLKPSPEYYRLLLSRFSLDAGQCLFIDDNPANVDGARAVGMKAVRFFDAQRLRQDLADLLA